MKQRTYTPGSGCGPSADNISRTFECMSEQTNFDVIVAGGGPVGLFLACELKLAGLSVLLLEKNDGPQTPLKAGWMGARGLNFPSTEAFYRRGLLPDVKAAAIGWM